MRATDAFALAIGRFVLSWSELEFALDLLALKSRLRARKSEAPTHQLARKVKYIRDILPLFAEEHRTEIAALLMEIEALSETRHAFVHGAVFDFGPRRAATLFRMLQPKGRPRTETKVTTRQVIKANARVREITDRVLDIAIAVSAIASTT